jgi:hypothetical protein
MPDRYHLLIYLCTYTEPVKFTAIQVNVKHPMRITTKETIAVYFSSVYSMFLTSQ